MWHDGLAGTLLPTLRGPHSVRKCTHLGWWIWVALMGPKMDDWVNNSETSRTTIFSKGFFTPALRIHLLFLRFFWRLFNKTSIHRLRDDDDDDDHVDGGRNDVRKLVFILMSRCSSSPSYTSWVEVGRQQDERFWKLYENLFSPIAAPGPWPLYGHRLAVISGTVCWRRRSIISVWSRWAVTWASFHLLSYAKLPSHVCPRRRRHRSFVGQNRSTVRKGKKDPSVFIRFYSSKDIFAAPFDIVTERRRKVVQDIAPPPPPGRSR